MKRQDIRIEGIPSVIWGEGSEGVIVAVHGNMSNKADVPVVMLADKAVPEGYQVLSFDLPEHGDRKGEGTPCKVQNCVRDLTTVMEYARTKWREIGLFANSMGAYFSLLAYQNEELSRCLFLSPVVDMEHIIDGMMRISGVTPGELEEKGQIATASGQMLYWDYYRYVKENPVQRWNAPICILYGEDDDMCESELVAEFARRFDCEMDIVENGEHYFHTPEQLCAYESWLGRKLSARR